MSRASWVELSITAMPIDPPILMQWPLTMNGQQIGARMRSAIAFADGGRRNDGWLAEKALDYGHARDRFRDLCCRDGRHDARWQGRKSAAQKIECGR
jgi:hypothetical protein